MDNKETSISIKKALQSFRQKYLLISAIGLPALVLTFVVASSGLNFWIRLLIFLSIAALFAGAAYYLLPPPSGQRPLPDISGMAETDEEASPFTAEVESRLFALEEANKFFGASLKASDMFRLVTSRIGQMVPFAGCTLFLTGEDQTHLKSVLAVGRNAREIANFEIPFDQGLAGETFIAGKPRADGELKADKKVFPDIMLMGFASAAAVPLYSGADIYGVLEFFSGQPDGFDKNALQLLEAAGERVAPLIHSSFTFEQNISNAMTDVLTSFPNERAFYLVLENQIAESQRYQDRRALTILSIDIDNFSELNQKYGHATGDQILSFAASLIRKQLRKMDFLARSLSDEFLVILPTAGEEIAREIIDRLQKAFEKTPFYPAKDKGEVLRLHFGSATFLKDGETADHLLKAARLEKLETKAKGEGKVIQFPKDFVN